MGGTPRAKEGMRVKNQCPKRSKNSTTERRGKRGETKGSLRDNFSN